MNVVPLRNIDPQEKITISYISTGIRTQLRNQLLKSRLLLNCDCGKCAKEAEEPVEDSHQRATFSRMMELMEDAKTDTTVNMRIQRLRYALHLHLADSQQLHDYPGPCLLRLLVQWYAEIKEYSLAFAFAILLREVNMTVLPKRAGIQHPQKLVDRFLLLRIMHLVIDGEEWETQEIDLASRGLNLVGLRCYWIEKLWIDQQWVRSWQLPWGSVGWRDAITREDAEDGRLLKNNVEERAEAKRGVEELAKEVLDKVQRW